MKISIHVERQFKEDLTKLFIEFKDIFAWQYIDMKGVDPQFCMHRINLKKNVVPVISQRKYGRSQIMLDMSRRI